MCSSDLLPYLGLVSALPPFHRLYWPVRATVLLVAAAVAGLAHVARRLPERAGIGLALIVIAAVFAEPLVRGGLPIGRWEVRVPDEIACLRDAGAGILLPYGVDQQPLVWQTVIEAPMLNGMAEASKSLVPPEQQRFRAENTWVDAVITAAVDSRAEVAWTEEDHAAAEALGYRWVALRSEPLLDVGSRVAADTRLRAVRRRLKQILGEPTITTNEVTIWGCR